MMIVFELDRGGTIDLVVTELRLKPAEVIPILKKPANKARHAPARSETTG